ncbi:MAG: (4Fe-4S)-binding protein [Firmicutes bacterium HGW-Firmicutes-14]|nr:MAG: (4Fe-4S)-binding protein [Firmicutes bacterium HGW-Firmicutes-14]
MNQVAIVSGKGGTGKTSVCASLVELAGNKVVADCDVEAPNLHLLLNFKELWRRDYYGSKTAVMNRDKCRQCGKCIDVCRFQAIKNFTINELKCEGCAACVYICPEQAIRIEDTVTGETVLSKSGAGLFSHARLKIGADGSGKLVTEVRKNASDNAAEEDLIIIDGSPGIACVVIASITGCNAILIVSEPTLSGEHDLGRVLDLADHFGIRALVCINKYDLNPEMACKIERYCKNRKAEVVGKIPFDRDVGTSISRGIPVINMPESKAGAAIREMWELLTKGGLLNENCHSNGR